MSVHDPRATDRNSRNASLALGFSLPTDVVLYLLLPMYGPAFGVSLAEAGVLLAANRLIRVAGYGHVARFYGRHGDRLTCTVAVLAAAVCSLGYATLSGFWWLLPLRLLWGVSFAALNLSTQALATAEADGAARRSGRSRAFISAGPVLALPIGALVAQQWGPRPVFFGLAVVALASFFAARRLPTVGHESPKARKRFGKPNPLDVWSFLEGLTLDGLFIVGLAYLGKDLFPASGVVIAGALLALRYFGEIVLGPVGGLMAERFGAERLLVTLSVASTVALIGFGLGFLWACAAIIIVLRSLQIPLLAPIIAHRSPGPLRVQALATRSVWRDIGAGVGPMLAGVLLPVAPSWLVYTVPAVLLAWSAVACVTPVRAKA